MALLLMMDWGTFRFEIIHNQQIYVGCIGVRIAVQFKPGNYGGAYTGGARWLMHETLW